MVFGGRNLEELDPVQGQGKESIGEERGGGGQRVIVHSQHSLLFSYKSHPDKTRKTQQEQFDHE